ncbi:hemerythrin domain-containing protein [Roseomonas marmotae]|uniref:Hemerythrin domain-containing protein n=1 Tax=Roseomonas marmotae TaxID=2768161 RepID=A0ABS3KIQ2_9PROT|nr:hemerythrin domain-containing protein [Roseomonas marmotae]MBO1077334.1 hemerythrin domain-containing protein [Roseomonas marmotae]QTI81086.1 hemerythrin domain-containing protein [Roseomonas marmotae]
MQTACARSQKPLADGAGHTLAPMLRLFKAIKNTPRDDPQRRDLMRILASELEIHEYVEDHIFYPAVRPVSEDVPIEHSEHRQLSDLLAKTYRAVFVRVA